MPAEPDLILRSELLSPYQQQVVLIEEVVGFFVCWVLVGQYDLYLPGPREEFLRTGRLKTAS